MIKDPNYMGKAVIVKLRLFDICGDNPKKSKVS
jgi:hypothetical protein